MSNDYFTNQQTLIPGDLARAQDVEDKADAVEAGFDLLPKPRPAGDGFAEPFHIAEATEDTHAATRGQLVTLEQQAGTHEANAQTAESGAVAARNKAEKWADEDEDVEVETGQYSSKHHAAKSAGSASSAASSATAAGNSESAAQGHANDAADSATEAQGYAASAAGMIPAGGWDVSSGNPPKPSLNGSTKSGFYRITSGSGTLNGVSVRPGDQLAYDEPNDVWFTFGPTIHVSDQEPTSGDGNDGDIWLQYKN